MSKLRVGQSAWLRDLPAGLRPKAYRDPLPDRVDVMVVGAGLTGCLTAWTVATATPKRRVLLIDSGRVGGASLAASGFLGLPLLDDYRALEKRHGRRVARALMEGVGAATRQLATLLKRGKIAAPVLPRTALRLGDQASAADAERDRRARDEAGLAATLLTGKAFAKASRAEEATLALAVDGAGVGDPVRMLVGAVRRAAAARVKIVEKAAITALAHDKDGAIVEVGGHTVLAGTVVVCTTTPPAQVRALQRHVQLLQRYAVRTAPLTAAMQKAVVPGDALVARGADMLAFTRLPDQRLLLSGGDQPPVPDKHEHDALAQRTGQLMYECLRLHPAIVGLQPTEAWAVPVASAADGWPIVGPHRLFPHHLFAFGTDHDPALAALASGILARAVAGASTRGDEAFGFGRL